MKNDGLLTSVTAITVVHASDRSLRSWGSLSLRAYQLTTEQNSLSSGAAIDCNLTRSQAFQSSYRTPWSIRLKGDRTWGMPVGCIPEETIRGNFNIVGIFRVEGSCCVCPTHVQPVQLFRRCRGDALRGNRPKLRLRPGGATGQ
jgi:hypothetical protein